MMNTNHAVRGYDWLLRQTETEMVRFRHHYCSYRRNLDRRVQLLPDLIFHNTPGIFPGCSVLAASTSQFRKA